MSSRLIHRAFAAALFGVLAFSASPAEAQALVESFREIRPYSFNADGTMNCGRWCGLLESCC